MSSHQALVAHRRKARHYAVQALYQWQMAGTSLSEIEVEFKTDYDFSKVDGEYFHDILEQVSAQLEDIDQQLSPFMDRDINEVGPVELALLRMAMYELRDRIDVPYKVVINEAVSLAKKFGATDSHKFINGVID
jgi:N utilization substance protein B